MNLKKPSGKTVRNIIAGVMITTAMATVAFTAMQSTAFEDKLAANQKEISTLEDSIKSLENKKTQTAAEKNKDLYSASEAGKKVAELQSKYQTLSPTENRDGVKANAEELSKLFKDNAQNGRTPWFVVSKGDAKAVWEFESTYSTTDAVTPVIWTCHPDNTDKTIAFATGMFDANENKFYDVTVRRTTAANDYIAATGGDDTKSHLDALIQSLQEMEGSDTGIDANEAQNQSDAREWLKEQNGGDN